MKLRNNFLVLCTFVIYASELCAMHCMVKRIHYQGYKMQKRAESIGSSNNLYDEIEAVGLKKCIKSYNTKKRCLNKLCCKKVLTGINTSKGQEKAQLMKTKFLLHIDSQEGRLCFLLRAQEAFNKLSCIEDTVAGDCDEDKLRSLISHQKACLYNQLRVIQEDTPSLKMTVQINLKFDEDDNLIIDIEEIKGDRE